MTPICFADEETESCKMNYPGPRVRDGRAQIQTRLYESVAQALSAVCAAFQQRATRNTENRAHWEIQGAVFLAWAGEESGVQVVISSVATDCL